MTSSRPQIQLDEALKRVRKARDVPSRRRVRTPVLLQLTETECGAACLGIVLAHFGRWVSIEELRETCSVGRDGCNAADIYRAARRYGLETNGWRKQPKELRSMPLPMILFWEFNHFVVLEGFDKGRFLINDPANGHRTISEEEFDQAFTGVTLTFQPGPHFQPGGIRPGLLYRVLPWLRDVKGPLAFAMGCGLLLALPAPCPAVPSGPVRGLRALRARTGLGRGADRHPPRLGGPALPPHLAQGALSPATLRAPVRRSRRTLHDPAVPASDAVLLAPSLRRSDLPDPASRCGLERRDAALRRHLHRDRHQHGVSRADAGVQPVALRGGRRAGRAQRGGHAGPGPAAGGREPQAQARAGHALRDRHVRPRQDRHPAGDRRRGRLLLPLDGAPGAGAAGPATLRRARLRERGPAGAVPGRRQRGGDRSRRLGG